MWFQQVLNLFPVEGDLYEDGLALKNGFFRTRRFAGQGSEAGSLELFSEERESEGEELEDSTNSINQAEAKRRRDRLEREEFIRKCKVLKLVECSHILLIRKGH